MRTCTRTIHSNTENPTVPSGTVAIASAAAGALVAVALTAAAALATAGPALAAESTAASATPADGLVQRGAYLVIVGACADCHTPMVMGPTGPAPDPANALAGHPQTLEMPPAPDLGHGPWVWAGSGTNTAFAGPWGVSFAANLTPDPETGLGTWTPEMFIAAMRTARHQGRGRPILPPMPVQNYAHITDDDLRAIFAYLHSLPARSNRVPQPIDPPEAH